ncbi:probable serine/threonine-protein kinase DDB_G0291350 [Zingiber officinale]|uniref:probable serine/threonine-protein kinase DDB_G0291350 n=1 Tax=Zingiber officinale TaxID=94328 RepID=UPI001C4C6558|nr:probable serine/threonine-protein kinase DDB_G0291350 [Zingiber officinale]XP_042428263.1 probable serine/threonine-protein kinase DDB_G0291350 [Zingiber officinale]XP_042428264.1 probable serine/threonine-protein kinase DDB_G0291350 [Zingiber officinale]XP_042428265.1 probable serine/threonine-protein kinase DDB_G0291350 [Zingiber officinale]XP_042428266.1 probable serine/threonine-protein kinase DDB_G0291350 [Zingiber officinale]XP_042428267.1 probable serine/threonine-protein kinase DDB_
MGCSISGLNALYDAVNGGGDDVWINDHRFRILRQLGEGGFAFVFLVKEVVADGNSTLASKKSINPSHNSDDGTYAMKKVIIQTEEQLELVKQEIHVSSLFNHPNLLPLIDHAIIPVKGTQDGSRKHEAYLLFPVHLDGTLLDLAKIMQSKKESFPTITVLHIFRQLCDGLKHMHSFDPPYAHNDVKPGNVLITHRKGQPPIAILMDFGSAQPARKEIRSRSEALHLQEWASEHCSAPFRAPELWDCPSHADIDERTDIWSLGCTLYAIMYGTSPFEYVLGESGGSLQLAVMNAQIKWPSELNLHHHHHPHPESLRQFVAWMLQPQPAMRPNIDDIIIHVDKFISKYSS